MWREEQVGGHPCDVFEPRRPHEHGYVVIYLHGVHGNRLRGQPVFTELFEEYGLRVAAPITGPTWWTDRICRGFDERITPEKHVLDNVVPWIAERWNTRPPGIGLLGTSMGGQGALRFAYKHPGRFPVVAAIAPAIDYQLRWEEGDEALQEIYDSAEAARQDTAILYIHPLNWPRHQFFCCDPQDERWWDSADRLQMKLYSLGVPHEVDLQTSAGGHGFEYYNRMAPQALAFVCERLEQERRRLPVT